MTQLNGCSQKQNISIPQDMGFVNSSLDQWLAWKGPCNDKSEMDANQILVIEFTKICMNYLLNELNGLCYVISTYLHKVNW